MFTTDTDIARIESLAFIDAQHAGQRLTRGTVSISGTTLTATGIDVAFDAAGLVPGHVAVVDGQALEIVERTGATTITVSRIRPTVDATIHPPSPVTNKPMHVVTFAPQRAIAHAQVMRSIGIDPDIEIPGEPHAGSIMNPASLVRLEAFGALHLIWLSASLHAGKDADVSLRAERYRMIAARERASVVAYLDLDGDGVPDAFRRPGIIQLGRS
jgi:hypothetical protein